jgi:hypothetical protein
MFKDTSFGRIGGKLQASRVLLAATQFSRLSPSLCWNIFGLFSPVAKE